MRDRQRLCYRLGDIVRRRSRQIGNATIGNLPVVVLVELERHRSAHVKRAVVDREGAPVDNPRWSSTGRRHHVAQRRAENDTVTLVELIGCGVTRIVRDGEGVLILKLPPVRRIDVFPRDSYARVCAGERLRDAVVRVAAPATAA